MKFCFIVVRDLNFPRPTKMREVKSLEIVYERQLITSGQFPQTKNLGEKKKEIAVSIEPQKAAYAVIPAYILYNAELSDGDKIIYGHISNLCNMYGFCWASNTYLAELTGKSIATIKRAIKELRDRDLIRVEHHENGDLDQRKIFVSPVDFSKQGGGSQMSHGGLKSETPGSSQMSHIIYKEEKANKNNLKEPPPPIASSSESLEPSAPQAPATPAGGGGGFKKENLLIGDWTYKNVRGEAVSLTQSQIFRHFVRLSFTTEILQEAIKQAMQSNELIGDPWKYLEAICFRLTQEKKKEDPKIQPKQDLPPKNMEPKVSLMELIKKHTKGTQKNG